jgi:hypothetical protein
MGLVTTKTGQMQGAATTAMPMCIVEERQRRRWPVFAVTHLGAWGLRAMTVLGLLHDAHGHRDRRPVLSSPARPTRQTHHTSTTAC